MDGARFVIEASEAESMAQKSNLSVIQLLPTLVEGSQSLARPSISKFHVGAVGLGSDGRIFLGVNIEFPNLPLHHSIHAEQFLLTNLSLHSTSTSHFAVSAAPCGHCRQFLQELRCSPNLQILITNQNDTNFKPLSSILPNPFGPFDLLSKQTPLLLEPHHNGLSLLSPSVSDLVKLALEGANDSHAPYSRCPSGVALLDSDGKMYKGCYMESAAYNPSLGPVQAAIVAFIVGGGGSYEGIVAAVLVERIGAVVRQEDTATMMLKHIAPNCHFRVFHCDFGSNGCLKGEA